MIDQICNELKDWYDGFNDPTKKLVIGISGGCDSTVCAALLVRTLGKDKVIGVSMPNNIQTDIPDVYRVFNTLGIKKYTCNIAPIMSSIHDVLLEGLQDIDNTNKLISESKLYTTNTPARARMITLYSIAAICNGLVCNTCNLSEDYIGYSTKWGDAVGDFSPLNKLTKTEVRNLGMALGLPHDLVFKVPSDGMCGLSDEDNLGFTYNALDKYIRYNDTSELTFDQLKKIQSMHNNINTKYKLVNMFEVLSDKPNANQL